MDFSNIQENAEIIEELLHNEIAPNKLSDKEFLALNGILLHLQVKGYYKMPEKYIK